MVPWKRVKSCTPCCAFYPLLAWTQHFRHFKEHLIEILEASGSKSRGHRLHQSSSLLNPQLYPGAKLIYFNDFVVECTVKSDSLCLLLLCCCQFLCMSTLIRELHRSFRSGTTPLTAGSIPHRTAARLPTGSSRLSTFLVEISGCSARPGQPGCL